MMPPVSRRIRFKPFKRVSCSLLRNIINSCHFLWERQFTPPSVEHAELSNSRDYPIAIIHLQEEDTPRDLELVKCNIR